MYQIGTYASDPVWHVLQFSDALDLELASALSEFVPVRLWQPLRGVPMLPKASRQAQQIQPGTRLAVCDLPLVRGFARLPMPALNRVGQTIAARLARQTADPQHSVLLCTTPFFAAAAEHWPGPVVYWLSDMIALYRESASERVIQLDRRMCRAATLVCPNSARIAEYLTTCAGCPPEHCHVLANATGVRSLLEAPLPEAQPLPHPYRDLPRPLAGVIGNLAENTDWTFLEQAVQRTPWLHWLFVGSADMPIRDREQRKARQWTMQHERTHFVGPQPYNELYRFARGVDVAVLPYRMREPTFSGSSTRFYDHLAAGHPILATAHVESLRSQAPLLNLVNSAEEAVAMLERLRADRFEDGRRQERWAASLRNTWRDRALTLMEQLKSRTVAAGALCPAHLSAALRA